MSSLIYQEYMEWTFTHQNLTVCFDRICEENFGWIRFFKNDVLVGYIEAEDFLHLGEYYEKTLQNEKTC